ncbi:MAG: hypothetical protein KF708_19295 [Pirellulales bacterium]|nr:hypothetical protein [Pirellulales bacterium]
MQIVIVLIGHINGQLWRYADEFSELLRERGRFWSGLVYYHRLNAHLGPVGQVDLLVKDNDAPL